MDSEQLCLFGCEGGCGVCGGSRDPAALDDCICVIETATGRVVERCAHHDDVAAENVIRIDDGRPYSGDPAEIDERAQETIEKLEEVIGLVRGGQATGVCIVYGVVWPGSDNIVSCGSVTSEHIYANPMPYLGWLSRLAHRINTQMDDDILDGMMEDGHAD